MSPEFQVPNFKNKKVIIMGLGLHGGGVGAAKFFAAQGAKILVTDLKDKKHLASSLKKLKKLPIKYVLGRHRAEDFKKADLIIKGPGVPVNSPYLKIARDNKIPIDTDIGIFFEMVDAPIIGAPIIGITGSKGKSTTAWLISRMLAKKFKNKVFLGGNICTSVFEILPKIKKDGLVILELSSFELEDLARHQKSPQIALITNILRDHQDRYPDLKSYLAAKKNIFKYQKPGDFLFLNQDDKIVKNLSREARGRVIFFGRHDLKTKRFLFLKKEVKKFPLYIQQNIIAAASVAMLFKIPPSLILKALKNFRGLEGRGETIAEIKDIKFVNDTCATIPDASSAILKDFKSRFAGRSKKIILICGGSDKNLDFRKFVEILPGCVKSLVLLPGTATGKIKTELAKLKKNVSAAEVSSMNQAVSTAAKTAKKGDVILLSPASASFGLFKNEFDRGEQFKKAALRLR